MIVNIHQAKTHLSQLLKHVVLGEPVIIAKDGTPIAKIIPIQHAQTQRMANLSQGKIQFGKDWDSNATNAQIAAMFLSAGTSARKSRKTDAKPQKRAPRRNRARSKS